MLNRRVSRPFVVVCAAVLMSPCLAASAKAPTPGQLKAAHDKVVALQTTISSLQVRAEQAAEAYNGALVQFQYAQAASRAAGTAAAAAAVTYSTATAAASGARTQAGLATARSAFAISAQHLAQQVETATQVSLDRVAAGAFQSGGPLGMAAQLFASKDPLELANGRNLMNQVSAYQQKLVNQLDGARRDAVAASTASAGAQAAAVQASQRAGVALTTATNAKTAAEQARRWATRAAALAGQRRSTANASRVLALKLVAQAESALGSAVKRAANLEKDAAAARAAASHITSGLAPSEAAATAIHWAFQEIGVPYSWGGGDENGPTYGFAQGANTRGFDCSGLTLFAYGHAGIHLDHYSGSQWNQGRRISSRSDLQPGDLMFFAYDPSNSATIHHVALYIGNGKMIEAPQTGDVVKVSSSGRGDFIGATRPWES